MSDKSTTEQLNRNIRPLENCRHERFALSLFKGMSQKDAALEAGYKESRAYETSSRLVRNGKILARILELKKEAESDAIMSVRERRERLSEIARARLSDFMECGQDGAWVNIGLDGCQSASLQEVKSRTEYDESSAHPSVITHIKLHDPIRAIAELNKMDGEYPPSEMRHTGGNGGVIIIEVVYANRGSIESPSAITHPAYSPN